MHSVHQSTLKREVALFEQRHVLKGTALGELDHPNYSSKYFKSLNLPNVSHQVGTEAVGHNTMHQSTVLADMHADPPSLHRGAHEA